MSNNNSQDLARQTVRNTIWRYSTFALGKGVVFVNTIILSRLLDPADFGLLALGLLAIGYLEIFNDFGVKSAVIYNRDDPERTANVAFSINMFIGVTLTALAFLVAPLISDFFREDRLIPILRVLSFSFVLSSFASIHDARIRRELKFKRQIIPEVMKSVAKGIVSISLAFAGYGVWSLVWGHLAGIISSVVFYWYSYRWIPKLEMDFALGRNILGYGYKMLIAGMFGQLQKNVDYLLIGRRMASAQLGYYTLAYRLPELLILNIVTVIGQVMFPTYSKLQNDMKLLGRGFLTTLRYVSLLTVPVGIGIFIITPEFVLVFYSDRWADAIPVMRVLSLYAVVYSLSFNCGDIYKATGRPSMLIKFAIFKLIITAPILYVAAGYNIYYVALGQLFTTVIISNAQLTVASQITKVSWLEIIKAIAPSLLSAVVMLIGTFALRTQIEDFSSVVRMILLVITGAILYTITLWLINKETLLQAINLFKSKAQSKPKELEGGI